MAFLKVTTEEDFSKFEKSFLFLTDRQIQLPGRISISRGGYKLFNYIVQICL